MDLNYLLMRHQVSLMRADIAACREARHVHTALARGYAARIRTAQSAIGITPMLLPA